MFIIYGTRTDLKTDAELQPVQCENCGHFAPQMRFTLFHIPTFGKASVKSEELCVKTVVRSILLKEDSTKKFVATLPKNTARRTAG